MRKGDPSLPTHPRRRRGLGNIYRSSIGKKVAMALAGLVLFGYVVLHLIGNLKAFYGEDKFNEYSEFLRAVGAPVFGHSQLLWIIRIILLVALLVHVGAFVQLWRRSASAREVGYRKYDPEVFSSISRTMKWGGFAILFFVVYHILHLTTGTVHPDFVHGSPFHNLVTGFQDPLASIIYVIGVVAVGMHLYHGLWSVFQTMGWNNPNYNRFRRPFAAVVAAAITIGFLAVPFGVWTGIVG